MTPNRARAGRKLHEDNLAFKAWTLQWQREWQQKAIDRLGLVCRKEDTIVSGRVLTYFKWFDDDGNLYFYELISEGEKQYKSRPSQLAYGRLIKDIEKERKKEKEPSEYLQRGLNA